MFEHDYLTDSKKTQMNTFLGIVLSNEINL